MFYLSEINRVAMIPFIGLFGLFLENKAYWKEQLTKNKLKIVKSNAQGNMIEFMAKKSQTSP